MARSGFRIDCRERRQAGRMSLLLLRSLKPTINTGQQEDKIIGDLGAERFCPKDFLPMMPEAKGAAEHWLLSVGREQKHD